MHGSAAILSLSALATSRLLLSVKHVGVLVADRAWIADREVFTNVSPRLFDEDSERPVRQSRRQFLLGIGVATAGLAGCLGGGDSSAGVSPTGGPATEPFDPASELSYGKWLTAADDGLFFAYANLTELPRQDTANGSVGESIEDPLVTYPLVTSQTAVGLGQVQLSFVGLTQALNPDTASESTVREITVVNEAVVAEGSFAVDKLDTLLTKQTDQTWGIVYEQTETIHGYEQYEPTEIPDSFEDEPPAVAVTAETIVVSRNTGQLERLVATEAGNQSRVYESEDTVAQLLESAGSGDLVVGEFGSSPDSPINGEGIAERDAQFDPRPGEDVVAALEFGPTEDGLEARFALAADTLETDRRERLETTFETTATDGTDSLTSDSEFITASGTYDTGVRGVTDNDESGEKLSQAAATELAPPEALAFRYEPPREQQFGEFWVAVREDVTAAAIQVEATSGSMTEIQPQERSVGAGDSIAVPVDPSGDSVTVYAVNEMGTRGKLATHPVPTDELAESAASQAVPTDALSFSYEPPNTGDLGSLTVEVTAAVDTDTLVAQPQEAPGLFTDRIGSLTSDGAIDAGATLETAVEPDGDEVIVFASVDGATGEVARWQGPE